MSGRAFGTAGLVVLRLACTGRPARPTGAAAGEAEPAGDDVDIVGLYEYQSHNAEEDKPYTGPVRVTKSGQYYQLRYDKGAGEGVGVRKGNTLAVAYTYKGKNGWSGGGLFTISKGDDGPVLDGRYTVVPGNGKLGKDKWTFVTGGK
ncbi:MAG: hypothetical protein K2P78_11625 [Gemmataceae bacterium]|nr:hypothetical protein [Gemmataceae bacterium]